MLITILAIVVGIPALAYFAVKFTAKAQRKVAQIDKPEPAPVVVVVEKEPDNE